MRFIDLFRLAIGNLRRNRMRTALTITGVTIGIGAIVFLVSLGYGLQLLSISKITSLQALTTITVTPGSSSESKLSQKKVEEIKGIPNVTDISATYAVLAGITYESNTTESRVYGVDPKLLDLEGIKVSEGKEFSSDDAKEIIVNKGLINVFSLESATDVLGKEMIFKAKIADEKGNVSEIDAQKMTIVGIIDSDQNAVYVPIASLKDLNIPYYDAAKVRVSDRASLDKARSTIDTMGFQTQSVKDTVKQIDQIFLIVKIILGAFGMIALLVASIGIFNTMTIALLERTHEIGIMKAIGATNKDISRMFVAEVSIIGVGGGVMGVLAGWFGGVFINWVANALAVAVGGQPESYFYTPMQFAVIAILFSFVVSTLAGFYPARRAAKLNPLEALRYE